MFGGVVEDEVAVGAGEELSLSSRLRIPSSSPITIANGHGEI